jgi:hypothetical protein
MEDFLAKQLIQSGLGAVGVLVLIFLVRELVKLQATVVEISAKLTKLDKKVAVIVATLRARGFMVTGDDPLDDDDNGN